MFKFFGLFGWEFTCFRGFNQLRHPFAVAWVKTDIQDGICSGTRPISCGRAKYTIKDRSFTFIGGGIHGS